jgi:hypothetical protein
VAARLWSGSVMLRESPCVRRNERNTPTMKRAKAHKSLPPRPRGQAAEVRRDAHHPHGSVADHHGLFVDKARPVGHGAVAG